MRYWLGDKIQTLKNNEVLVFGTDAEGLHESGISLIARNQFGAVAGVPRGHQGQCYALVTKNLKPNFFDAKKNMVYVRSGEKAISMVHICLEIAEMFSFARKHPDLDFLVPYKLNAPLMFSGYDGRDFFAMFMQFNIPDNVVFHESYQGLVEAAISCRIDFFSQDFDLSHCNIISKNNNTSLSSNYPSLFTDNESVYVSATHYAQEQVLRHTTGDCEAITKHIKNLPSYGFIMNGNAHHIFADREKMKQWAHLIRVTKSVFSDFDIPYETLNELYTYYLLKGTALKINQSADIASLVHKLWMKSNYFIKISDVHDPISSLCTAKELASGSRQRFMNLNRDGKILSISADFLMTERENGYPRFLMQKSKDVTQFRNDFFNIFIPNFLNKKQNSRKRST